MANSTKGIFIRKIFLPSKIKIEAEKREDGKWLLRYEESVDGNPDEVEKAIEFSIKAAKDVANINVTRNGNTVKYTLVATQKEVAGLVVSEFMQFSPVGELSFAEIWVLATLGVAYLRKYENSERKL